MRNIIHVPTEAREFFRRKSEERNRYRQYATSTVSWKRGFVDNAAYIGILGEYAVAEYLKTQGISKAYVDTKLYRLGDGGADFTAENVRIQVKTRTDKNKAFLVRRTQGSRKIPLDCQIYIFTTLLDESHVELTGWCDRESVSSSRVTPGKEGGHTNHNVPLKALNPMEDLVREFSTHSISGNKGTTRKATA